ncbi:MAG: hypothetical protein IBJ11_00160 [Phycisphaerales bacterium]|nr:hypothetical protein [Phycisphaerales bacterium]
MIKLLQKYRGHMLVFFGVFLMVSFLLPQAISQFGGTPASIRVGTLDGAKVSMADLQAAQAERNILDALGAPRLQLPPVLSIIARRAWLTGTSALSVDQWLLMTREAERAGLVGGPEDGSELLADIADMLAGAQAQELIRQGQGSPDRFDIMRQTIKDGFLAEYTKAAAASRAAHYGPAFDRTMARARGVWRLVNNYSAFVNMPVGALSSDELRAIAGASLDTLVVDVALIPAASVGKSLPAPDDAALAAFFDRYKTVKPRPDRLTDADAKAAADLAKASAQPDLGIGYFRPPSVRLESISILRNSILGLVKVDPIEARKYWSRPEVRQQFPGDNFDAVRGSVETALRTQAADRLVETAREIAKRENFRALAGVPSDGVYRRLPADWDSRKPSLEAIAQAVREELARELKLTPDQLLQAVQVRPDDGVYRGERELRVMSDLGASFVRLNQKTNEPFPAVALAVRELAGDNDRGVQTGNIFGPLEDNAGNAHLFRVTASRQAGPPTAWTDVADDVKRDFTLMAGYEKLAADADAFKRQVVDAGGLSPLTSVEGVTISQGLDLTDAQMASPDRIPLPEGLDAEELRKAMLSRARAWDPKSVLASLPTAERAVALPIPGARGLAVALATGRRPLTREGFDEERSRIVQATGMRLLAGVQPRTPDELEAISPFSMAALSKRLNYVPVREEPAKPTEEPSAPRAGK